MNLILFDDPTIRTHLLPLAFTRPVAGMRVGILTIAEKWETRLKTKATYATEDYLSKKFSIKTSSANLWVNGALCPDENLIAAIAQLKTGDALLKNSKILAAHTEEDKLPEIAKGKRIEYPNEITIIDRLWKIFQQNGNQIRSDFKLITANRQTNPIQDPHTRTYKPENIFIEEGVTLHAALLNAENGPIYLGKNSQVQEGAIVRGPFSLGEGAIINMGGKMRADTTVGPFCKIGGEVSNSVLFGNSNKAHDGFLGNSVLGEWCNLGADTNTSNLKNTYQNVKVWSYTKNELEDIGSSNCGLLMGDHSKSGIGTLFNTGTVVGISCNIFGSGFMPKHVPSFSWGGTNDFKKYELPKALDTAERVMGRRNLLLSETDREILTHIAKQAR
ncbi:MAG: GlmU family protein [Bacteroidetes bacterium]|nr:GlmU family protein [Bacteroidota bacterium]MBS1540810.1 GlmU family protein [Bacteroidota bacterium]